MGLDHYIFFEGKRLQLGYTTGTCAALAASAAVYRLLHGQWPGAVSLVTPKGIRVEVTPEACTCVGGVARCAVRKDGGDDVDATHGALIFADVRLRLRRQRVRSC